MTTIYGKIMMELNDLNIGVFNDIERWLNNDVAHEVWEQFEVTFKADLKDSEIPNSSYWLIESRKDGDPVWLCNENSQFKWTRNNSDAIRFSRKKDAKEVIDTLTSMSIYGPRGEYSHVFPFEQI